MTLITDNAELTAFCDRLAGSEFITVDTEFIRDKTYWPVLCLIQIGGPDEARAIDAMAEGIDLAPVFSLLSKPELMKVFHAARQDFEIFYQMAGIVPAPVFDTQVSAMVCGFGEQVAYDTLAAKLAKARIDKTMRFTDWARRPLTDKQLDYALADVTHLRIVYEKLTARLEKTDRAGWVAEEMARLTDPRLYQIDPRETWRRIKVRTAKPRFLAVLRELAAWRETEAQIRNVPRNRVLRDEGLVEIAAHNPTSKAELNALRSLRGNQAGGAMGDAIIEAVRRGLALPEKDCPAAGNDRGLAPRPGPSADLLKVLLKMKAEQHDVAQRLIASTDEIEAIAADDNADVPALTGWRRELFGEDALALKQGRLALTASGGDIRVVELDR